MRFYSLIIAFSALILLSCGGKKSNTENKDNKNKATLSQNDIFNLQTVKVFLDKADKEDQQEAKKEFLIGVDQYRNRNQVDSAITSFKHSITIYPFAKTYYELGNAFMDKTDFKSALDAYGIAEGLEFDPISLVLYNKACAYSMMKDGKQGLKQLQLAIENGYVNIDHILGDSDLVVVRAEPNFNETVKTAMAGNTSSDEVMFSMFKSHFASLTLPYKLDENNSQELDFHQSIAYDYVDYVPGMVNQQFSRDVGDEYFYVGKIIETEKYVGLVYSQAGMWDEKPPVHVYLVTYKPGKGEVIDMEKIAGMEYYSDSMRTAVIKEDLSVEVKYFIQEWEKNPDDFGYYENKRTNLNLVASRNFKIDEKGNIRELKKMIGSINNSTRRIN